ncbi:MAG: hypothetical protein A3J38_04660 [Gammaproteobacteria bacterium RIFCSPHIGHO2_12_FULL_45_9]|nr:MAG: hypothetical protein A3J38_04660 [Gammaproteobacteria bacterium RIFCSPHIGHO2_12_FULL_45_9]
MKRFQKTRWIQSIIALCWLCGSMEVAFAKTPTYTIQVPVSVLNKTTSTWTLTTLGMPGINSSNTNPSATVAPGQTWSTTLSFTQSYNSNDYLNTQNVPVQGRYTISLVSGNKHIALWPLGMYWIAQVDATTTAELPTITGTITYYVGDNFSGGFFVTQRDAPVLPCEQRDPKTNQPVCGPLPTLSWEKMGSTAHQNYGSFGAGIWYNNYFSPVGFRSGPIPNSWIGGDHDGYTLMFSTYPINLTIHDPS